MAPRADAEQAAMLANAIPARLAALGSRLQPEDRAELASIVADLQTLTRITAELLAHG